jgi:glycosyltransferase involved in cell wall biosynthesis
MHVAIAHDWLIDFTGSEECVRQLCSVFPGAPVLTSVIDRSAAPPELAGARASLLQHVPGASSHHEWFLPLMPLAWRARPRLRGLDAVISSSHACAKAVRVEAGTPHLCYCHAPMRYAWDFRSESGRFPRLARPAARAAMAWFRRWDRRTAERVTRFVANSTAVAGRIERYYGRRADVIHPPVRTDFFTPEGEREDFFLYVGRFVSYKRPDLVVAAFAELPHRVLMVGTGQMEEALRARATSNVTFLGRVDDERLRQLYRAARALVYPADEDFGIVMAEAQACGTPVIGLAAGGALDIVEHGVTGWLVPTQSIEDLRRAARRAARETIDEAHATNRAKRFSAANFRSQMRAAVESMVAAGHAEGRARAPGPTVPA